MRSKAVIAAVVAFFILAGVGLVCELPVFVCATRAVIGAAVTFVGVVVVRSILTRITVDTIMQSMAPDKKAGQTKREH
jgi:hypothetical protein